jgi:hypothetical protein
MRNYAGLPELWPRLGSQRYQAIVFTLAGLAAVAVARIFTLNTNLLFVVYLSCSYAIVQLLLIRLPLRLGLLALFLFFLFYSPNPIPALPEQNKLSGEPWQSRGVDLAPGATRSYRFMLAPLRSRQGECDSLQRAEIYVHGTLAAGEDAALVLSIDGGTVSEQTQSPFLGKLTVLRGRAEFSGTLPDEAHVRLHNRGQKSFAIYLGPEIANARVYPEAVFMKFDSPKCHIVVHANPVD